MFGVLSVIGVGPGDPELLTLKAVKIIKESPVICVPKGREEGSSLALSIVEKAVNLDGKEIIEAHFPMRKTRGHNRKGQIPPNPSLLKEGMGELYDHELDKKWNETAKTILNKLEKGTNVAFLTLGDPTIYSTFFYLYDKLIELIPDLKIEIIPGVSSINAAASKATMALGLGDEKIAVLPANYMVNLKATLEDFDTVVLMKVNKVFNEIVKLLENMDLVDNAKCISRAGMEDERIFNNIKDIKQEELNYFSMVIIRKC